MIRPLRRRHRIMMLALTLTVPALLVSGLLARRAMPDNVLPAVLSAPASDPADVLSSQLKNTGSGLSLRISTLAPEAGSDRQRIEDIEHLSISELREHGE